MLQNLKNQKGIAHILLILTILGIVATIFILNSFSFNSLTFNRLFGRGKSFASSDTIQIVDDGGNQISTTTSVTVQVKLTEPTWPSTNQTSSNLSTIKNANIQSTSATNLIKNPGCETNIRSGEGDHAVLTRITTIAHSGKASCQASYVTENNIAPYYGITDDPPSVSNPKQNEQYTATAWVRSDNPKAKPVFLILQEIGSKSFPGATNGFSVNLTKNWQQITVSRTISKSDSKSLKLYVRQTNAAVGEKFQADDFTLNLIANQSPSPTPTSSPTTTPTPTPSPTAVPTPVPVTTVNVILAEDPNFQTNVQTFNYPLANNPVTYTFSDSAAGNKLIYAKFTGSDGSSQNATPYPVSITLIGNTIISLHRYASCKVNIGPQGYYEVAVGPYQVFNNRTYTAIELPPNGSAGNMFKNCRDQNIKDAQFFAQNNIRNIRFAAFLSTFAFDPITNSYGSIDSIGANDTSGNFVPNINNLDDYLSTLNQNNIKATITLNGMISYCGTTNPTWLGRKMFFNDQLVTNKTLQDQYINSLQQFLTRYKNNPAIDSYDLASEISYMVLSKGTICNWTPDTADDLKFDDPPAANLSPSDPNYLPNLKNFLKRIYQTAKQTDPSRPVTFAFGNPYDLATQTIYRDFFKDVMDFYDIHAYSFISGTNPDAVPETFYDNLPSYDKPLRHGEGGMADNPQTKDSNGVDCAGINPLDPLTYNHTWMDDDCQNIYLDNTKRWVAAAKAHGVTAFYFHDFPLSTRFGQRIYQVGTLNTVSGYRMTKAGQYIINLNCPTCIVNTTPP